MHDILKELERVLVEERSAIRKLDVHAIDLAATKKNDLENQLTAAIDRGETLSPNDRGLLENVRSCARANQLLLVHARACVRGVVSIVSGRMPDAYPASSGAATSPVASTAPVRVNVTG